MHGFNQDLRHSVRLFLRTPSLAITAIAALALGIASSTAIFSVVNTVLLKPFDYPDPERVVMFQNTFQQHGVGGTASPTEFNLWREQAAAFQDFAAYSFDSANLTGASSPELIQIARVNAGFFRLSGAKALYGRTFQAEDDVRNARKTAVLSYQFWQQHFGREPSVLGKSIILGGETYEIVGVRGPDLNGQISETILGNGDLEIDDPPQVYLPFRIDPASTEHGHSFNVIARLRSGVTLGAANSQLQASYQEYARRWPDDIAGRTGFRVVPLREAIVGSVRNTLLILLGGVSFVLLIACANVANLLLARMMGRKRELAIRAAMGASRGRIVRQLLTESLMLSLSGGMLGLAGGYAALRVLLRLSPGNIPRIGPEGANVILDGRVFAFALGLSVLTGIVFGLMPALQSSRTDLRGALKQGGNRAGAGLHHTKARGILVITEVSLAFVLLVGAGLLIRTFLAIREVNPGFDAHRVLSMRMSFSGPAFKKPETINQVVREALRRIRVLPGVVSAGATCCLPLVDRFGQAFKIARRPPGPASQGGTGWAFVTPGYFETFKIPLLRGRAFTALDENGPPVVVINQTLARAFWPDSDPTQDQMIIGNSNSTPRRIIGVVGDVRDSALNRDPRPNVYLLSAQLEDSPNGILSLVPWAWVIRTKDAPQALSPLIQNELRQASGGLPVAHVRTMGEVLSQSAATQTFNMVVLMAFAGSALLLATIGIYGLMSYTVAQRSHEIGIRLALGAESSRIRGMVVSQSLRLVLAGVTLGLAAAIALTRLIVSLLFGVKPLDTLVFFAVPAILVLVALAAAWLPARRASRLDPIQALRSE